MSDRVERVAKELFFWMYGHRRWDEADPVTRDDACEAARAAIEAAGSEFNIAKLELGPRDVLVVKTAYHISDETVARVRQYVSEQANISNAVLVIQPDLDLAVLTRSEIEERVV